jgi:hypothetical protein
LDAVNLSAYNTGTFVFSRSLTPWADLYRLDAGKFRAHMRASANDPVIYYEWSTDNRRLSFTETKANGTIAFASNPVPGDTMALGASAVVFVAPGASVVIAPQATVTMTIASPCVVSWAAHGFPAGTPVNFTVAPGGSLATGIVSSTIYYISITGLAAGTFQLSDTQAHALAGTNPVNTSGSQSGVITGYAPTTIVFANHGLTTNTPLVFATTGALPTGVTAGPPFYVLALLLSTNTFQIGTAPAAVPIQTSGSQSGTQSVVPGQQITPAPAATVTLTLGSPGIVNWAAHGLPAGTPVMFSTTGNLPGGIALGQTFYISNANILAGSFTISATLAGALSDLANLAASLPDSELSFGGAQSGVHTATAPTTILWNNHALVPNTPVIFETTGALPAGLLPGVVLFVSQALITTNTFQVSSLPGGLAIIMTAAGSGVQTITIASNNVRIGGTLIQTLINLLAFANGSADPQISLCVYSVSGTILAIQYNSAGSAGNLFGIACSTAGAVVSGKTLAGAGGMVTMTAPIADIAAFLGNFVYDCRWESLDGRYIIYLFGGTISWLQGVTRTLDVATPTIQFETVNLAGLATLIPVADGDCVLVSDLGGGAGPVISVGGLWERMSEKSYAKRLASIGTVNLQALVDANTQQFVTNLTGNLAINLSPIGIYPGASFRIIAPASLSGNTFTAGGVSLLAKQFVDFVNDGTNWNEIGVGEII